MRTLENRAIIMAMNETGDRATETYEAFAEPLTAKAVEKKIVEMQTQRIEGGMLSTMGPYDLVVAPSLLLDAARLVKDGNLGPSGNDAPGEEPMVVAVEDVRLNDGEWFVRQRVGAIGDLVSFNGLVIGEPPTEPSLPLTAKDLKAADDVVRVVHEALKSCPYSVSKRYDHIRDEEHLVIKFLCARVVGDALAEHQRKLRKAQVNIGACTVQFGPVKVMAGADL